MIRRPAAFALLVLSVVPAAGAAGLSLERKLEILVQSYPETLSHVADGKLYLRDGGPPIVIDDGRTKTHAQALVDADIKDMLAQVYPPDPCAGMLAVNFDPGRIRSEKLMRRIYGSSRKAVVAKTVRVDWFGHSLLVTRVEGAAQALERVRADIARLPARIRKPAMKSAGTFNRRKIAGTDRLSVHSFAAAIDLDTDYADYWRWVGGKPGNVPRYANRYPLEIVEVFERHGFIWGGRWYHYDTMHFEYRPEMIAIARASGANACKDR
ncbi:M15 family metallopeptidase [Breoghania sp.]|uniref:M15 family metallopeptidase n=1 Tax=Breoghania sp. TaxID=2065378 RepID=UPI002635353D|nr:M15 family metallopeptidase [Breoghania sp.]MDJ0931366.1 M15 family metallopeptidase [Breoghania sp.]